MTTWATILTLSHQYGSGGSLIARDLGRRLNWAVWDKEIVRTIAAQPNIAWNWPTASSPSTLDAEIRVKEGRIEMNSGTARARKR